MLLTICHRTVYRYARPVTLLPHRMMLCPRGQHDLRLLTTLLSCTPPAHIEWTQDVFGNLIATATFWDEVETLTIDSRMVVDQSATAWPVFSIAPSAQEFPFTYSADEVADLGSMRDPQYPQAADSIRDWIDTFRGSEPTDTLTLLKEINTGILAEFAYRASAAERAQSPDETIHSGHGSCRDFATLFIEAVRQLGFGARAVSGYMQALEADEHGAGKQYGAAHAWAEVYLPCAGWSAFDPTHARMGGAGLIPVAVARTVDQIRPVQGGHTGAPDDLVEMLVDVNITAGTVLASAFDQPQPAPS
ncbi:transglutaminase family protein [Sphingomonas cannabina]|uniref:transglutaminase family protein n=1 Tax=Sphingomonas cannabina TaxID=2899123 RepID=UPI001F473BCC|nr:transglutaminase family protein [Sphingomonas cannabina]UIJ44197.1 transglutaminase family protein [Sphingomonas cannabina]